MWPGVEPQRGIYNETYLHIVKDIVEEAATYGIYVLADMHQEPSNGCTPSWGPINPGSQWVNLFIMKGVLWQDPTDVDFHRSCV